MLTQPLLDKLSKLHLESVLGTARLPAGAAITVAKTVNDAPDIAWFLVQHNANGELFAAERAKWQQRTEQVDADRVLVAPATERCVLDGARQATAPGGDEGRLHETIRGSGGVKVEPSRPQVKPLLTVDVEIVHVV